MAISIDLKNNEVIMAPEATRIYATGNAANISPEFDPNGEITHDQDDIDIDKVLAKGKFMTPSEYYSIKSADSVKNKNEQGYYNTDTAEGSVGQSVTWFWLEEFKNWCSFFLDCTSPYTEGREAVYNTFMLYVWNGLNGWMNASEIAIDVNEISDVNGIRDIQNNIMAYAKGDYIIQKNNIPTWVNANTNVIDQKRGMLYQVMAEDDEKPYRPIPDHMRLQRVKGIRLQKTTKYTINDTKNFQTIRWNSVYAPYRTDLVGIYAQSNVRFPITTGIPPVWRSPTGDVFLATHLSWNGDGGSPYVYKADEHGVFCKDTKVLENNPIYDSDYTHIYPAYMMGNNDTLAAKWINDICAKFFGSGNDKTIENDWLREKISIQDDTEEYTVNYTNMLDTTKTFEQHNINKENSMKCTFVVNRPVVTTEDIETKDYAKKW